MKKCRILIIVVLFFSLLSNLIGCTAKTWDEKDFSFYAKNGEVSLSPSKEKYSISLDSSNGAQTNRKVMIGDNAVTTLNKYDLTDSSFQIRASDTVAAYRKAAVIESFQKRAPTLKEIIACLSDLAQEDLSLIISCNIYQQNGVLCTLSALKDDGIEMSKKLKYTISFEIIENKIADIYIISNYHHWLAKATDDPQYDWIRELGK